MLGGTGCERRRSARVIAASARKIAVVDSFGPLLRSRPLARAASQVLLESALRRPHETTSCDPA
jgi:hypothetical protein